MIKTLVEAFQKHQWLLPTLAMLIGLTYALFKLWKEHRLAQKLQKEHKEKFPDSLYEGSFGYFTFGKSQKRVFDTTLDNPLSFGNKCIWIAVLGTNIDEIKSVLKEYYNSKISFVQANFKTGYAAVENEHYGYILPNLENWIIIWDNNLQDISNSKTQHLLSELSGISECAQFYGNHSGVGYGAFGFFKNKECTRAFSIADGTVSIDIGKKTQNEIKIINDNYYKIKDDIESIEYYKSLNDIPIFGHGESILNLAEEFSLNPMKLNQLQTNTVGFAYEVKN